MVSTITFSGLSSGIDTSAWVDALVSVKQQTVTVLEEEKKAKENLLSVVNNIKSYFSSFQTCLQKLTDAQYGIASMDLFLQNLATSSDTNILTATATTEAARQSYDVLVEQLASSTKASSGYKTNEVQKVKLSTELGILGVKAGTVSVGTKTFNIQEDDTIKTLIEKFSDIGVIASFDERNSKFTVNTPLNTINDGDTGLKNALKLKDKNITGSISGSLVYADKDTELSKLNLTSGDINIEGVMHNITKTGNNYNIQKNGSTTSTTLTTVGDFLNYLLSSEVNAEEATIDNKGNISIKGASIEKVSGGSNLIEILNLGEVTERTVIVSNNLTYAKKQAADFSTTLKQIGINGNTELIIDGNSNTILDTSSLQDIKDLLNDNGIEMSIDSNGVIKIDNKGIEISGTLLDALKLKVDKTGSTLISDAHVVNFEVSEDTLLSELGIDNNMGYIAYDSNDNAITAEIKNIADITFGDFIKQLQAQGLNATFDTNTSKLIIDNGYITGDIANILGMITTTQTVQESANENTTLENLGATADQTLSINNNPEQTYNKNTTLATIITDIENAGGTVELKDGILTIKGVSLSGTIPALLGLEATTKGSSITSGEINIVTDSSSTSGDLEESVKHDITLDSTIGDITGSTTDYTLNVNNNGIVTYSADKTLNDLKTQIENAGGTFKINTDNTISIEGVSMTGSLVTALGFGVVGTGTEFSSVNPITINQTLNVSEDTTFNDMNIALDKRSYEIYDNKGNLIKSNTTDGTADNSTFGDWISSINSEMNNYYGTTGITYAKIENGIIKIDKGYAIGDLLDSLGITTKQEPIKTISSGTLEYRELKFIDKIETKIPTAGAQRVSEVTSFSSGGTYKISDASDLQKLATLVNSGKDTTNVTFILTNDIDMSGVSNYTPIGNSTYKFKGDFYGNGHTISNLTINLPDQNYVALFGYTEGSTIQDIGIDNIDTQGKSSVAGLIGSAKSSTITNSYITGSTSGTYNIGGLIGYSNSSTITNSYAMVNTSGTSYYVGGLVGDADSSTITNSYATGSVNGTNNFVGGLIGNIDSSKISNSYATGEVNGKNWTGGLIGFTSHSVITNSYATGNTTGASEVGGLVGTHRDSSIITNSYATGNVNGNKYIGGLVGSTYDNTSTIISSYATGSVTGTSVLGGLVGSSNGITITNSYYSISTGQSKGTGDGYSTGITQATTEEIVNALNLNIPDISIKYQGGNSNVIETTTLDKLGLLSNGELRININGYENLLIFNSTDTIQNVIDFLNTTPGINVTFDDSEIVIETHSNAIISGEIADLLNITTGTKTSGVSVSGDKLEVNTSGEFISEIDFQNIPNGAQRVSEVTSFSSGGKYLISDASDLEKLSELVNNGQDTTNVTFILTNDIDMSGVDNFTQIGYSNSLSDFSYFNGTLYGNGHIIKNLNINQEGHVGLFWNLDTSAIIKDLGIENANINETHGVSGILAAQNSGTIINSYATGTINGSMFVGGLVGMNLGTINNSYSNVSAQSSTSHLGGLVGGNIGSITNSYSIGTITGKDFVGGLIGYNDASTNITNSYSLAKVTGTTTNVGGLIGFSDPNSNLSNNYYSSENGQVAGIGNGVFSGITNASIDQILNNLTLPHINNDYKAKTTTTLEELGITTSTNNTLNIEIDGVLNTKTFQKEDTIQDIVNYLSGLNLTATFNDGKINISSDTAKSINIESGLGDILFSPNPAKTIYSTTVNEDKILTYIDPGKEITENTLIKELLGSDTSGTLRIIVNQNSVIDLEYNSNDTIDDIINDLKVYGINATIENGVFKATSTDKTFVLSGKIGNALAGSTPSYQTIGTEFLSNDLSYEKLGTANMDSTLEELGVYGGKINIVNGYGKVINSIDLDEKLTLNQVKSILAPYGFDMSIDADGKLTVSSDLGYSLSDSSSNMVSKLGLTNWTQNTAELTQDTTLAQMGFESGANLNILLDGTTPMNIAFGATDTLQDIINSLQSIGINANVDTNGVLEINSYKHSFVFSGDLAKFLTQGNTGYINTESGYANQDPINYNYEKKVSTSNTLQYTQTLKTTDKLEDIGFKDGGTLRLILDNSTPYSISFYASDTIQDVIDTLNTYGINMTVDNLGKVEFESNDHTYTIGGSLGNYLTQGGIYNTYNTGYVSDELSYNTDENINLSTKLTDLGVTTGYINIIQDGNVNQSNIRIDNDTTVGQLFNALKVYGMNGSIETNPTGDTYIQIESNSNSVLADGTSNLVTKLGLNSIDLGDYKGNAIYWNDDATSGLITEDMLLADFNKNGLKAEGSLEFDIGTGSDIVHQRIYITADDTVSSLLDKFTQAGIDAKLEDGLIKLSAGINGITFTGGTSGLVDTLSFDNGNVGVYASSESSLTYIGETNYSVANFADANTKLDIVNVTDGTLSIYVDGIKCSIQVNSNETFSDLFSKISGEVANKTGLTLKAGFLDKNGNIVTNPSEADNTGIVGFALDDGHNIAIGASNDTTNFATIVNLTKSEANKVTGSRALYKVNGNTIITQSDLFRLADVTEGTFTIGDAEFTINAKTTFNDLISQINKSDKSYASAYWDTLSGTMVIQSELTGASLINIESGTSNFTDVMGFTKDVNGTSALVTDSQTLGKNAIVKINGSTVTSTSNTITSDISRIKGLTINLKGLTKGESVTIEVEQDNEGIYNAVADAIDAYNTMMEALNKELADESTLGDETILKLMRNNLKRLMTSSIGGASSYKNLSSIGISTGEAQDSISTDVTNLIIDKDALMEALENDSDSVKKLLIGDKTNPGIFLQANNIVESSLKTSGYFTNITDSLNRDIKNIQQKITRTNDYIESYKARLEKQFKNMELTITSMQTAYSSFLGNK